MKYFGQLIFIILTNLILVHANNNEYTDISLTPDSTPEISSTTNETPTSSSINEITTPEFSTDISSTTESSTTEDTLTTVQLTTSTESSTISPCETTDSPVQNLKITSNEFSLVLEWTPPKLHFCKYTYKIEKSKEVQDVTSALNYIITGLKPCQSFNISVITLFYNDPKGSVSQFVETAKIDPEAVENLELITIIDAINITWSAPEDSGSCIDKYYYKVFQDELLIWESVTRDTYLTVIQPSLCVNYTYIIYPSTIEDQNGLEKNISYSLFENNEPPRNASKFIYDDYVVLKWQKGDVTCGVTNFYVHCTSSGANLTRIGNIEGDAFTATLTDLLPYTPYTCYGFLANKYFNSSYSKYVTILTKPKAPDSPTFINIQEYIDKYLRISWDRPKKWNGIEIGFHLTIANLGPTYEVYRRCKHAFNCTTVTNTTNSLTTDFVSKTTTEYSTKYKISMYAISNGGKSKIIEENFITSDGAPEPPILVNYDLIYSEGKTYSANLTVKWEEPCKMNGEIKEYLIYFVGIRTDYDKDQEHHTIASATDDNYKFTNLKPEYTYTVQISARNANNIGETVDVNVITKAGGMMKECLVVCPI